MRTILGAVVAHRMNIESVRVAKIFLYLYHYLYSDRRGVINELVLEILPYDFLLEMPKLHKCQDCAAVL